jgi:L-lactate utilization protein LutB
MGELMRTARERLRQVFGAADVAVTGADPDHGPRRRDELDGPDELHIVVVDNGRSVLRRTRYAEMLTCIRCGACLNVCPVYRKTGGTPYSDVYRLRLVSDEGARFLASRRY